VKLKQQIIKKILQKEDPVILELGAHTGEDTKIFLKEFKDVKIYCFEPDPRCIKQFKKFIKDDRCVLIEAAVSNESGTIVLNMSSGWPPNLVPWYFRLLGLSKVYMLFQKNEWDYSSSIKKSISNPESYPWLTFDKKVEVPTVKLDSWVKENSIKLIDFIWSDIQGAEKDMLEGAGDTLKISRYLFTEYGEVSAYVGALTREDTISLLQKNGFELMPEFSSLSDEKTGNLLFRNKDLSY
jgi:2-O-methyltransferase